MCDFLLADLSNSVAGKHAPTFRDPSGSPVEARAKSTSPASQVTTVQYGAMNCDDEDDLRSQWALLVALVLLRDSVANASPPGFNPLDGLTSRSPARLSRVLTRMPCGR